MKLLVFNPEHDIALAANLSNFTAPHAGRQLRADLGFLPALWAGDDDAILVDHAGHACRRYNRLRHKRSGYHPLFVEKGQLAHLPVTDVEPWGWDLALRSQLLRHGVRCVPTDEYMAEVRRLSHRGTAAALLSQLRTEGTVGESFECVTVEQVDELLRRYGQVVLKAPWSSSGRGLRFLSTDRTPLSMQEGWLRNLLKAQGSVMVEPYYLKVRDFGMEFEATPEGIRYLGLSLFHTANGAYTGNLLATEETKWQQLARYVSLSLLDDIRQQIVSNLRLGSYQGPFGIDMMAVSDPRQHRAAPGRTGGCLLHPCVEINLRRTMGHVALHLTPPADEELRVMRIVCQQMNYKLKIQKL